MKAEATLQFMADFYPRIFPTRKHALNQMFCVIGNGMDWINGELVDDDNPYLKRYQMIQEIDKAEFSNEEDWNRHREFLEELYEDEPNKISMEYQFDWYPLDTSYSKLYTFPDDIKPDWKTLIEECIDLLKKDGVHVDEEYIARRFKEVNNGKSS